MWLRVVCILCIMCTSHKPRVEGIEMGDGYRINLKLPSWCADYLKEAAWINRTTVTGYLTELIANDSEQHPEILESARNSQNER